MAAALINGEQLAQAPQAPQAQPTPAPEPVAAPPAAAPGNWWDGFKDEQTRGVAAVKKWADQEAAVKSYAELETVLKAPKDRHLVLPEKMDDAAAMAPIYEKLGRPAKPEDYKFTLPEGAPIDDRFIEGFRQEAFKAGTSQAGAQAVVDWYTKELASAQAEQDELLKQRDTIEAAELRRQWGQAYDERTEMGRRGYRASGWTAEDLTAVEKIVGPKKFLTMFANAGIARAESRFIGGEFQQQEWQKTPDEARGQMNQKLADPAWSKRAFTPGTAEAAELERLQKISVGMGA